MRKFTLLSSYLILSIFSCALKAQTGPGGVGNSSTNLVWIDASTISTSTPINTKIASLTDLSGNGNNFTQTTDTRKPLYQPAGINTKPSLRFSSHVLKAANNLSGLNKTTFSVIKPITAGNNRVFLELGNMRLLSMINTTTNLNYNIVFSGTNTINSSQNIGTSSSILGSVSSSSSTNVNLYVNNNIFSFTRNTSISNFGGTNLGANNANSIFFNGQISETIVYEGQLNTAQITIINNYLSSKYAIAITGDKFAFDGVGTNGNNVFGIGRDNSSNIHNDAQGRGVVRVNTPSSLDDGDYMLIGDNNGSLSVINNENPSSVTARYGKEWRTDKTGDVGTVTLTFDVSSNPLGGSATYVLLTDSDGDFSNATVSSQVSESGGFVTFTNVTLNDGDFFTLGNEGDIESVASGSWQTAATWNCNCVPSITQNVIINSTHSVTIDGVSFAADLTIENGATLTFNPTNTLSVSGNFVNDGTLASNDGTFEFIGTSTQTIGGTVSSQFGSIIVNNANTVQLLTSASLTNELLLTNGNFDAGAVDMTLISDASNTARIGVVPGGSMITGNFIIQRFVPGGNAYWDYLSSPVQSSTILDWDNEILMSGVGGADGNAFGGPLQNSVRTYNEVTNASVAVTSTSRALNIGEGFQVFLGDNTTTFASKTFDTRGVPTFGDQTRNLSFTSAAQGYNVVGNPFASGIDWANVFAASTNLSNEYYIYDKTIKNFAVWNGSSGTGNLSGSGGIIPSSQGFMVRTNAAAPQIVFNESAKVTGNPTWVKPQPPSFALDISVQEKGNIFGGKLKIINSTLASDSNDELDAGYIENTIDEDSPNIYSEINNDKSLINVFEQNGLTKKIDLFVKANREGNLELTTDLISNKDEYTCILIEDVSSNKIIDLKKTPSYSFEITNKEVAKHFVLHLDKSAVACDNQLLSIEKNTSNNVIFINNTEQTGVIISSDKLTKASISVTNIVGQEILTTEKDQITEPTKVLLNLPSNAIYIIRVTIGESVYINKIIR